jgi:hypothetical protein
LFQQEVALAKAEARQTVNKAGQAAGMYARRGSCRVLVPEREE